MADLVKREVLASPEPDESIAPRALPVQKRAKETVNLILETAAELVDEVGVVAFSTNMLAERAGIRIRTVYRYYPNKLGVLVALMIHLNDDSADQLDSFAALGDVNRDWREVVDGWIEDLMTWTRERPGARLLMAWSHCIPELVAIQARLDNEWTRNMMTALRVRGVELPQEQLYSVCRSFSEILDSLSVLAVSDEHECKDEMIEEMRRLLFLSLAEFLD